MKRTATIFAAIAVLALAAPSTAVAQDAITDAFGASASSEPLTLADVKALAEILRGPAAPAPAPAAPAKAHAVSEDGAFGFSWATILSGLGNLLLLLFAAFKGPEWVKARKSIQAAAETGWLVSERLSQIYGLKGAQKASVALGEFLKVYSEGGIAVPPGAVVEAQRIFAAKSAEAGLAVPVPPAQLAGAQAAAQAAAAPGTATDLADRAAG